MRNDIIKLVLSPKQVRLLNFALDAIAQDVDDYLEGSDWNENELYTLQAILVRELGKVKEK